MGITLNSQHDSGNGSLIRGGFSGCRPGSPGAGGRIGTIIPSSYVLVLQHDSLEAVGAEGKGLVVLAVAVVNTLSCGIINIVGRQGNQI